MVTGAERFTKILAIIGFISLILALTIIATTPQATGYEISIYAAYSPVLWLFIILSISCGIIILVYQSYTGTYSKLWVLGYFTIIFTNLIILILPLSRSYIAYGRGDVLTHIGFTQDIISTGHFGNLNVIGQNIYPVIHIFLATIDYFTGINVDTLSMIVPIFFTLFYFISIYMLSRVLTDKHAERLLITAVGSILLFRGESLMIAPSVECFYVLPIIVFLSYKMKTSIHNKMVFSLLVLIFLILTPFFHPGEGTILLLIVLLGIDISFTIYDHRKKSIKLSLRSFLNISSAMYSVLLAVWLLWFGYSSSLTRQIQKLVDVLLNNDSVSTAAIYASTVNKANLSILQILDLVIKMYGQDILFFGISLLICILLLKNRSRKPIDQKSWAFMLLFFIFCSLMFITYFVDVSLGYNREMRYTLFASTILNGIGFYFLLSNYPARKIISAILVIILISTAWISLFNIYSSPLVVSNNYQVTKMELLGMEWFMDHRNEKLQVQSSNIYDPLRFIDAIYGRMYYLNHTINASNSADHFNYNNQTEYGSLSPKNIYIVEDKLNRIYYPEVIPQYEAYWRFTPEDYHLLDTSDVSVDNIYSNGEFWSYEVQSTINI